MAYNIYHADGTLVVVPDNAIDNTFYNASANGGKGIGIQLNGRNAIDYGRPTAQTWLQMTENFASSAAEIPTDVTSLVGQLWFNKDTSSLSVKVTTGEFVNEDNWRKIIVSNPVNPSDGDIQVVGSVISIWANGGWNQVFPAIYSA